MLNSQFSPMRIENWELSINGFLCGSSLLANLFGSVNLYLHWEMG